MRYRWAGVRKRGQRNYTKRIIVCSEKGAAVRWSGREVKEKRPGRLKQREEAGGGKDTCLGEEWQE